MEITENDDCCIFCNSHFNLSEIPTNSFSCFIEKSEFPIYPQLLQILQ